MTQIYLYRVDITKAKNAKIEAIRNYLAVHGRTNPIEVQYQQIALNKTIKLDLAQAQVGKAVYNYLEIYQDSKSFYFFIDKATWKSTSTVEFELTLDTVNTFSSDFTFNKKTHITRQHKDRLKPQLIIDTESIPVYDDPYPVGKTYIIANKWTNLVFETTRLYTDDTAGQLTLIKYQNNKVVGEWPDIWFVGRLINDQTDEHYWQVFDYDGDIINYSDDEMKDDNDRGIYWAIRFDDNQEIFSQNVAWPSLFAGEANIKWYRVIDQVPEGINPPQFKVSEETINETGPLWNLVYITEQAYDPDNPEAFTVANPLHCYLYPETSISDFVVQRSEAATYTAADLTEGQYYFFIPYYVVPEWTKQADLSKYFFSHGMINPKPNLNYQIKINIEGTAFSTFDVREATWNWQEYAGAKHAKLTQVPKWVILYKSGDTTRMYECTYVKNSVGYYNKIEVNRQVVLTANWSISFITTDTDVRPYRCSINPSTATYLRYWNDVRSNSTMTLWTFGQIQTLNRVRAMSSTLKTDSRVMKIIQLPYIPLPKIYDSTYGYVYDINGWQFNTTVSAFEKIDVEADTDSNILLDFDPVEPLQALTVSSEVNRNDLYESKIYNSEFYTPKFVYDSFSYNYNLENVDINALQADNTTTNIDYKVSNTFSGNFLFGMKVPLIRSTSDYDNIVIVNRNNEKPVYTSAFMNYVRSGYNWDVKNKNLQLTKSIISGTMNTVQAGAIGFTQGGWAGAAVGAGSQATKEIIGTIFNQISADNNIKQKLDETSRQSVSVNNCDDINLLNYYTNGNKAKYCIYQCSDNLKSMLLDLFYYFGYTDNVYEIPNLNSRKWFNYIECDPVFNEEANTPYKEYLEDIKQRYQAGITVYHNINGSWDLGQVKENWETSL